MSRILVVEDDVNLQSSLRNYLVGEGFDVTVAGRMAEARQRVREGFDLIILDWKLPDGQGITLLKEWRAGGMRTPILLLTARAQIIDKVLGLEVGANDYITKPFEPRELLARIHVQLRALEPRSAAVPTSLEFTGIMLSRERREVRYSGTIIELKKLEFELLQFFLENPGKVFSREELLNRVWGYENFPTTRTVDTHILALRTKLHPALFETIRGIGYRLQELTETARRVCEPMTTASLPSAIISASETQHQQGEMQC